jgi:hypothetical protein
MLHGCPSRKAFTLIELLEWEGTSFRILASDWVKDNDTQQAAGAHPDRASMPT